MTDAIKELLNSLRHMSQLKSLSGWTRQAQTAMGQAADYIEHNSKPEKSELTLKIEELLAELRAEKEERARLLSAGKSQ